MRLKILPVYVLSFCRNRKVVSYFLKWNLWNFYNEDTPDKCRLLISDIPYFYGKYINVRSKLRDQKIAMILVIQWFKNWSFQKMLTTEKMPLNSNNFWHWKLTLKVRNQHFLIDEFRIHKNSLFMKKCYLPLN